MERVRCIVNDQNVELLNREASATLDILRRVLRLTGTKEGCREGDCGACTVLVGELEESGCVRYLQMNSCLLPFGDMEGKHIVTVEGITPRMGVLSPIQQAMADEGGAQCGFCTPGFIMSLTGYALNASKLDIGEMGAALDGNICRCTGYVSIRRAIERFCRTTDPDAGRGAMEWAVERGIIPEYFLTIPERLRLLRENQTGKTNSPQETLVSESPNGAFIVGGGTDLFVQKPEALLRAGVRLLNRSMHPPAIREENGLCVMDAHLTITALGTSEIIQTRLPRLSSFLPLFASAPIRNRATLGGNLCNASPIGDMAIILLALDAELTIENGSRERRSARLRSFYKGYKTLDLTSDEIVREIRFALPDADTVFSVQKVSRRKYLDIASVNSAALLRVREGRIEDASLSAGGVAPVPLRLASASNFLSGKSLSVETVAEGIKIALGEIAPIGDARGSAEYKSLLLERLLWAHFIELFPDRIALPDFVGHS